jgi:two-component system chemotaxis response regulator CheB
LGRISRGSGCEELEKEEPELRLAPMKKIRVLVVDDSVVVRRLVSELISTDPSLEVVGVAANGRIALEKIPQVNPNIVTLDIDMPDMDGLEALASIRRQYPRLPVIILSTFSERGAAVTLEALVLGASDYVTKPAHAGSAAIAMAQIRNDLLPKVKALCGRESHEARTGVMFNSARWERRMPAAAVQPHKRVEIVAIGVSTGGPNALSEIVSVFPTDFPVPVVIVQHMPPVFTRILAERLSARASIHVREGVEGGELSPGSAWIAPGNHHMEIARKGGDAFRLKLNQDPPENSCRPAVDVLFRSVALNYGNGALAVILTGMGQDGLRGCEAVAQAGGQILAQDQSSSVVWGMPGFVVKAGLANRVVSLSQLGEEILRRVEVGTIKREGLAQERLRRVYLGN